LLFIRALSTPRTFDNSDASFISPCDSLISDHGVIQNETAFQIKGMQYSIRGLLNKIHPGHIDDLEGGNYMNFYLSPKDYHRYHIPIDCKISRLVHVPGKLYPVNMTYLNKQQDLFIENERAIVECIDVTGRYFYLVFVGVQDTMIKLYIKKDYYKEIAKFSTWLYTIAKNLALTELRKRKRKKVTQFSHMSREEKQMEFPAIQPETGQAVQDEFANKMIHNAIQELPEHFKTVVILRDVQELSYDEISEIVGVPLGTVKSRINRARIQLQSELQELRS